MRFLVAHIIDDLSKGTLSECQNTIFLLPTQPGPIHISRLLAKRTTRGSLESLNDIGNR